MLAYGVILWRRSIWAISWTKTALPFLVPGGNLGGCKNMELRKVLLGVVVAVAAVTLAAQDASAFWGHGSWGSWGGSWGGSCGGSWGGGSSGGSWGSGGSCGS